MPCFLVTLQADLGVTSNTVQRTFAVSETPQEFWWRNAQDLENTVLLHSVPISSNEYTKYRPLNPANRGQYWRISDTDASSIVDEEEDSEEDSFGGS